MEQRKSISVPTELDKKIMAALIADGKYKRVGNGKYSLNDFYLEAIQEKYDREYATREV